MDFWEQTKSFQQRKLVERCSFRSIYETCAAREIEEGDASALHKKHKNNEVIFSSAWNIIFTDN